ncbi:uncharacterized protein znf644b [Engraulis encrasicolus]|uniref:uncharacterized protein znf644b n=1 Tax=Engraulis encrasicolus TaxID=184585 RepID=UPI002FD47129
MADIRRRAEEDQEVLEPGSGSGSGSSSGSGSDRPWHMLRTSSSSVSASSSSFSPPPPPAQGISQGTTNTSTATAGPAGLSVDSVEHRTFNGPQSEPGGDGASASAQRLNACGDGGADPTSRRGSDAKTIEGVARRKNSRLARLTAEPQLVSGVRSAKAKAAEGIRFAKTKPHTKSDEEASASASEAASDSDDSNFELPRLQSPRKRTMYNNNNNSASAGNGNGTSAAGQNQNQNQNQAGNRGSSRAAANTKSNSNTNSGAGSRSLWDFGSESSESSSEDCEEDATWEPQSEFMHFLMTSPKRSDSEPPPPSITQSRRKRKLTSTTTISTSAVDRTEDRDRMRTEDEGEEMTRRDKREERWEDDRSSSSSSFVPLAKQSLTHDCSDSGNNDKSDNALASKERKARRKPNNNNTKSSAVVPQAVSELVVETKEHFISNNNCYKGSSGVDDTESASAKPNQVIASPADRRTPPPPPDAHKPADPNSDSSEPLFFPCVKCNVNFKEKAHLHRHMLIHQAPANSASLPRPFICRECGRSFRAEVALQRHMVIHQTRRERLMEEIKGLTETQDEGRGARLQCPQCVFGTGCAKTFVQHAKTHEKDKRYYCCDGCSLMATSQQELQAHRCPAQPARPENHHAPHNNKTQNSAAALLHHHHQVANPITQNTGSAQHHHTNHTTHHHTTSVPQVPPPHQALCQDRERLPMVRQEVLGTGTITRLTLLHCKICPFSTPNDNILKKHIELIHRQPYFDKNEDEEEEDDEDEYVEEEEEDEVDEEEGGVKPVSRVPDLSKPPLDLRRLSSSSSSSSSVANARASLTAHLSQLRPKLSSETSIPTAQTPTPTPTPLALHKGEVSPAFWSAGAVADLRTRHDNKASPVKEPRGPGPGPGLPLPSLFNWSFGSSTNKLSAGTTLPRLDKPSKLSPPAQPLPPPTVRIDVTQTGHLEEEEKGGSQKCAAPPVAGKVTVTGLGLGPLLPGDKEKTKHISATAEACSNAMATERISATDACSNAMVTDRTSGSTTTAGTAAAAEEIQENHQSDRSDIPVQSSVKASPAPQPTTTPHRTVSKRKMSIPFHNKSKPKPEPMSPVLTEDEDEYDFDDEDDDNDDDDDNEERSSLDFISRDFSSSPFLGRGGEQRRLSNSFMSSKPPLYLHRSRLPPPRKDVLRSNGSEEEEESDCDDINDLVIKEECEDVAVDVPSPPLDLDASMRDSFAAEQDEEEDGEGGPASLSNDMKTCPYCPAVFESGVGLSNHVRGHLHRVGLSYDARHMVSPEQVASRDRQPRIRRKAPSAMPRRIKKASVDKPESRAEHTCPLCWGWFDTRTGLSNHVRGHLKRIGRGLGSTGRLGIPGGAAASPGAVPSSSIVALLSSAASAPNSTSSGGGGGGAGAGTGTGNSRSPLSILNELLRDETEHRSILALLGHRRPAHARARPRPFVSQNKLSARDSDRDGGLFLTPTGVPGKAQHQQQQQQYGGRGRGGAAGGVSSRTSGGPRDRTAAVTGSSGGGGGGGGEEEEQEIRVGGLHHQHHHQRGQGGRGRGYGGGGGVDRSASTASAFASVIGAGAGAGPTVVQSSTLVELLRRRKQEREALMRQYKEQRIHDRNQGHQGNQRNHERNHDRIQGNHERSNERNQGHQGNQKNYERNHERIHQGNHQGNHQGHAARRQQLNSSPARERESVGRLAALKPDPDWSQGKADVKKVCMHCNATFHSAVSLSNHLRAYARRKRAALLDGTTYECKPKKPRSRPGPKKKTFSLPHTPEEIYRLTCRFCDLVFQGPLSVQEDWIKHLQRHLMHTSVPHTGAAMVEVTAPPATVCNELSSPPPPPERLPLPPSQHNAHLQMTPSVS